LVGGGVVSPFPLLFDDRPAANTVVCETIRLCRESGWIKTRKEEEDSEKAALLGGD
jgi:hypothetical protein